MAEFTFKQSADTKIDAIDDVQSRIEALGSYVRAEARRRELEARHALSLLRSDQHNLHHEEGRS